MTNWQHPKRSTLELFKKDLWKDQRRLDSIEKDSRYFLVKHFASEKEAENEVKILKFLSDRLSLAMLPKIFDVEKNKVTFLYIRGIRIFNLFVELDQLGASLYHTCRELKQEILNRCEAHQKELQKILIEYQKKYNLPPYPAAEKILSIIYILSDCLNIRVEMPTILNELNYIYKLWIPEASIPFRDATIKNMALAAQELWLGNFESEKARRTYLLDTLLRNHEPSWLKAPIIDFDFSSCLECSTPEDDPISLKYHERTWISRFQTLQGLNWGFKDNGMRAALTFLIRYYRFGGRKAAYRLLHPLGHRIRFRHDNDIFYFERLPGIILKLWPEAADKIPKIMEFTAAVARYLHGRRPEIDYFISGGFDEKRQYYTDMYPQ